MVPHGRILIVLTVFFLLAAVTGGFFVLKDKERTVDVLPAVEEASLRTSDVRSEGGQTTTTTTTQAQKPMGEIKGKLQEIAKKTEELAAEVKILKELEEAQEKSSHVKGIYVGTAANPSYFKNLLDNTELNAVVIDVKEASGPIAYRHLRELIDDLHQRDAWVIARIVVFRDSSQVQNHPEWYLQTATSTATSSDPWQDSSGQYWLDPKSEEVYDYLLDFSKQVIDYGFDELQLDYIRYPDDYPVTVERIQNIGNFFEKISKDLKGYKASLILSADLFGYVATQFNSFGTGQRLVDAGKHFDYLSFMLYPSHFYGGFEMGKDEKRELPSLKYSYPEVIEHPYQVVLRSVLSAQDYLSWFDYNVKIRPWLQDFDLKADKERGVIYDAEKVRLQIQAAVDAGASGWLLWNPSYVYTKEALAPSQ